MKWNFNFNVTTFVSLGNAIRVYEAEMLIRALTAQTGLHGNE